MLAHVTTIIPDTITPWKILSVRLRFFSANKPYYITIKIFSKKNYNSTNLHKCLFFKHVSNHVYSKLIDKGTNFRIATLRFEFFSQGDHQCF